MKLDTLLTKVGFIKNYQSNELPTKTYVYIGSQGGRNVVYLHQLALTNIAYYGLNTLKKYKSKYLISSDIIIRYETLGAVWEMVSKQEEIFNKLSSIKKQ